jgi:septum formation protein
LSDTTVAVRDPVLVLASTSPQRRAILAQLRIPFTAVAPDYEEHDPPDADPVELVRRHAEGKARSAHDPGVVTLGVDTTVHLDGRVYGKPEDAAGAERMLRELGGRTHEVLSGLCLLGPGFAAVEHETTRVTFRPLADVELDAYLASGEWQGRAGAYAIQGLGGRLVERIEGDYLNVVGLPGALLVTQLERHAPNLLQIDR